MTEAVNPQKLRVTNSRYSQRPGDSAYSQKRLEKSQASWRTGENTHKCLPSQWRKTVESNWTLLSSYLANLKSNKAVFLENKTKQNKTKQNKTKKTLKDTYRSTKVSSIQQGKFTVVLLFSHWHVQLFLSPWTAACQDSQSFTLSQSSLKLMPIESVMPSNHLILCHLPSPPALTVSQHWSLFPWVSSSHQVDTMLGIQ